MMIPENPEELTVEQVDALLVESDILSADSKFKCEPELEAEVASMRPRQRRRLAQKLARYAHQLIVTANMMDRDEAKPKPVLPRSQDWETVLN